MLRIVFLVFALAAAGGGAWLVLTEMQEPAEIVVVEAPKAPPPTEILVAADVIDLGQTVAEGAFKWRQWPKDLVTPDYILRANAPDALTELVGSIARSRFVAGEPILMGKLADGTSGLLAAVLAPGERAMAVRISAENTAGGFVLPGDRVDVLLTKMITLPDGRDISNSSTILRNIEVLAIDQVAIESNGDSVVGKTATLRLSGMQAEQLAAAEVNGRLSLALRAAADRSAVYVEPEPEPEPEAIAQLEPEPEPEAAPTITVRRGGVAETVSMP